MRVLVVAPYLPGPLRARSRGLVAALAARGHALTVVGLDDGGPVDSAPPGVRLVPVPLDRAAARRRALAAALRGGAIGVAYGRAPELARAAAQAADGAVDVVHVEHLRAAFVADALGGLPRVFDAVDCLTELHAQIAASARQPWRRWVAAREAAALGPAETAALRRFDAVAVTTPAEADALAALAGVPAPVAIPNGVDTVRFRPDPDRAEPATVVFHGKASYLPNDDAAFWLLEAIWPRVRAAVPDARLRLVGAGPARWLRGRDGRDGVTVTGAVDDLSAELVRARVALCPLRIASGIQNKALEALACGLPVVCTERVARALPTAVGDALSVAGDADALAAATVALLRDPEAARSRGAAGRRAVERACRWDDAAAAFEELYRAASGHSRR